jgi:aminomethyltransferase
MLTTPLNAKHQALGASFTDFGGWSMPIRYGSDLDEHHAVRNSAGLFDISHMGELRVLGDAAGFLDYALTGKLSELKIGKAKYTLITNSQGNVIDDLIVYRMAEQDFLIVANASNRHAVLVALMERVDNFEVEIRDESEDWALLAIQGPKAAYILQTLTATDLSASKYYSIDQAKLANHEVLLARTGYTGEDGFEVFIKSEAAEALWDLLLIQGGQELTPCGLASRDTLRLEAGMPLYGHELNIETNPYQAGLGKTVRFDKADFLGRGALFIASTQTPKSKLYGLKGEGKRAARADYELYLPGGAESIGIVTSGALSPTLGYPISMAFLDGQLNLEIGSKIEADVRGTRVGYEVVDLPFYKRGK